MNKLVTLSVKGLVAVCLLTLTSILCLLVFMEGTEAYTALCFQFTYFPDWGYCLRCGIILVGAVY